MVAFNSGPTAADTEDWHNGSSQEEVGLQPMQKTHGPHEREDAVKELV